MRIYFTIIFVFMVLGNIFCQTLNQVIFTGYSTFSSFSILTDQGVLIRLSDDGKILEWGMEVKADRFEYYAPKLQPYMGRVDYFGPEADSSFRGKVRNIGTCFFTYYTVYDMPSRAGKIKSIGSLLLDYYSEYENVSFRGKIRFLGRHIIEYYTSSDNESYKGKIKAVGNTTITYYSSFDDKLLRGKLKAIGSFQYKWPTSLSGRYSRSEMDPGWQRRYIDGVIYVVR